MNIAFHIADRSVTFFAKGRPWVIAEDHEHFSTIRNGLMSDPQMEREELVSLADPIVAIRAASNGKITIEFDNVFYNGEVMHNVWVEKLLGLKVAGLPFDPLIKALESLQKNPTAAARERLPIFVEQSKLGILPDGRIAAMKVIRSDYTDCHSGTFDNTPGMIVEQARDNCDPDPNNECSTGLHLGAYAYLPSFGLSDSDKRVVLCAFWPEDVVAVPRDYSGQKMRVCRYEVLEELTKSALPGYIEENQIMMQDYELEVDVYEGLDEDDDYDGESVEGLDDDNDDAPEDQSVVGLEPVTADQVRQIIAEAIAASKPKPRKRKPKAKAKAPPKKTVLKRKTPAKKPAKKKSRR